MKKIILSIACFVPLFVLAQDKRVELSQELKSKLVQFEYNSRTNFPSFLKFNAKSSNISLQNPTETSWAKSIFPLRENDGLAYKSKYEDLQTKNNYYKYQQTYRNVPVEFAILNIKAKAGNVQSVTGDYHANIVLSNHVVISKEVALEKAKLAVPAKVYKWERKEEEAELKKALDKPDFSFDPNTTLVIFPFESENGKEFRYAYKLDIFSHEPMARYYVYIDAENGNLLEKYSRICAADVKASGTTRYHGVQNFTTDSISPNNYILRENNRAGRGMKIETRNCQTNFEQQSVNFTNSTKTWNIANAAKDEAALDCHFGAEQTYDYYYDSLNYNSFDGNGSKLLQYVHYDFGYFNAFWTGSYSCYGDGTNDPLTGIDVVSHEITHGVTQYTADLVYASESGALNESFSDIFGTVVEFNALGANASWTIGVRSFSLRDMSDPLRFNNPDTYGGDAWTDTENCIPSGNNDGCGVHNNSGVQNFWFYILSQGDTSINDLGNAYSVAGIGMDKAAKIAFRNLRNYLGPMSNYNDARRGSIEAAIDLYGYDSPEMIAVVNAWYAVGVGKAYSVLPEAEFKFKESVCAPNSIVQFVNTSGSAFSYQWDFGDGKTSTQENPSNLYSAVGKYTVRLIATNPNGNDTLTKVDYIIISNDSPIPSNCEAKNLSPIGTTGIYHVEFAGIDNESPGPLDEEPYMDFTCSRASIRRGETYPLKITTFNTSPVFTRVYIDWNNNGNFDVPSELVMATNNIVKNHSVDVTVPNDAVLNIPLRMRIVSAKPVNNTPDVVCSGLRNGQIEDYSVSVSPALGLNDNKINHLSIYPNPASNHLVIKSSNDYHEIYLIDLTGREILKKEFTEYTNLDVSNTPSGVYLIKVITGSEIQYQKVIIER